MLRPAIPLTAGLVAIVAWCRAHSALAGPPLIADDPHTIGPGAVQPIVAVAVFRQGDDTLLRGPILDLTVGAVDSLDFTLVVSLASQHDQLGSPSWTHAGFFIPGLKWEFFRTDRGSLALSPALFIDTNAPKQPAGLLPIQGELTLGDDRSVIGFDVGYLPIRQANDEWFIAPYGIWAAHRRLNILSEVWFISVGRAEAADLGFSVGLDWGILSNGSLRLIAAGGTGFVSFGAPRVNVRAYLGTQYTFRTR